MKIIHKTIRGTARITIEEGIFLKVGKLIAKEYPESKIVIITDKNLAKIYKKEIQSAFIPDKIAETGYIQPTLITVPANEKSKSFEMLTKLAGRLLKKGFARNDVIVGIGGGLITDLSGFLASVYMRGIAYISIPTSMLSMVDAGIGGKTGINFISKNSIGAIYMAHHILIDPDFLNHFKSLKDTSGMGEVIKYAVTIDKSLLKELEKPRPNRLTIIEKSVKAKVRVTTEDLLECGMRKLLNYGHTFGHAIEKATKHKISHNAAICIGMVISNRIAQNLGKQKPEVDEYMQKLFRKYELPTELPKKLKLDDLIELIKKDKKRRGKVIDFVICPELGKAEIVSLTPKELIKLAK